MTSILHKQQKTVKSLFALAILCAGCYSTLPPEPPPEYDGVRLQVSCPSEVAPLFLARSRPWSARHRAVIILAHDAPNSDVVVFTPPELASYAPGGLAELPKSLTSNVESSKRSREFDWGGLLPEYREQLLLWDRIPFAVPLVGEAPVCVYRSDLFADPAHREPYRKWQLNRNNNRKGNKLPPLPVVELRAPQFYEEFASQAEFFRDQLNKPSLPPLPSNGVALDRLFYTVAAPYVRRGIAVDEPQGKDHLDEVFSFHFNQQSGEPRIDSPGFVAALELLARLQACRPAGTSDKPEEFFMRGEAVLCLTEASWLAEFQSNPKLRNQFGNCSIPGAERFVRPNGEWVNLTETANRVPYLGEVGWLAAVRSSSTNREAALDLLLELAGPAGSRQTAMEPRWGGPTRTEHLLRESWDSFDLDPSRSSALRESLTRSLLQHNIKNPVVCLRTPDQARFRAALVTGVRTALTDKQKPADALTGIKQKWNELIAQRGKERHAEEYRISLGLLGR